MSKIIDMTNWKMEEHGVVNSRIIVIKRDFSNHNDGKAYWFCKCSCGNEKIFSVSGDRLRRGNVKSCGCLSKENSIKLGRSNEGKELSCIDETGNVYEKLTVMGKDPIRANNRKIKWICKCECGNIISVVGTDLRLGHTKSCGCIKSHGEKKIAELLQKFKINFQAQKIFEDCKDLGFLKFDFYISDFNYLIEYDGIQHFKTTGGWSTEESLQNTQFHDEMKNNYCKQNNIPLIRIPYSLYDSLSIEDLILDTTKYRVC